MSTIWSDQIFGIDALRTSRDFRFHKLFSELYLKGLPIQPGMKLLDLGCGPGSFTRCVYDWLHGSIQVSGLDIDNNYIDYCRSMAIKGKYNIEYYIGDACATAFPDACFDITTSFTLAQHVDNERFFKEQYRLLKTGGSIIIMDVSGHIENIESQLEVIPISQEEFNVSVALQIIDEDDVVKKEHLNRHKYPDYVRMELLEKIGFGNIRHHKIKIFGCPDNPQPTDFSQLIIDNFYCHHMDIALNIKNNDIDGHIKPIAEAYIELVKMRKAKRIEMFNKGQKLWDSIETDINIIVAQKYCDRNLSWVHIS